MYMYSQDSRIAWFGYIKSQDRMLWDLTNSLQSLSMDGAAKEATQSSTLYQTVDWTQVSSQEILPTTLTSHLFRKARPEYHQSLRKG